MSSNGADQGTPITDSADWGGARLAAYWAGECTPTEAVEVERWIQAAPGRADLVARLKTLWTAHGTPSPTTDSAAVDAAWRAFRDAAATDAADASRPRPLATPYRLRFGKSAGDAPRTRWPIAALAAAIVVALGVGFVAGSVGGIEKLSSAREFATTAGQRRTVTLSDGSKFTLGPESRLLLGANYGRGIRDLYLLAGEAYFTVAHDARHPFAVHVQNAAVRDIGTRFTVRAYPGDVGVRLAVAEGAVAIDGLPGILRRSDVATVTRDGAIDVQHDIDIGADTVWTAGRLAYDAAPLGIVLADLSRWYGVPVRVGDSALSQRHVTATIEEPTIEAVLDLLSPTVGARYEHHGAGYTLYAVSTRGRQ